MKFTVITANYNGDAYLEETICSVLAQRQPSVELEYIVIDGNSTDNSLDIIHTYADEIAHIIVEKDSGPANAINKGLAAATGDIVSWLNSDDLYYPGTLLRIKNQMMSHPEASLCFGACPIIDRQGREIRRGITRFKELFFSLSGRFTIQCINYISQPAMFFRGRALQKAGFLNENLTAAWDYDFILRLWQQGGAFRVKGPPLAAFRWHDGSISGRLFKIQFREEWEAAARDAGKTSIQSILHFFIRYAITGIYWLMERRRLKA